MLLPPLLRPPRHHPQRLLHQQLLLEQLLLRWLLTSLQAATCLLQLPLQAARRRRRLP